MRTLVAFLLLCSVSLAEPPVAVITGGSGGVPGDLIVLDASESIADHFAWTVIPELPDGRLTILPIEGGKKCIVASVPGQYTVVLAVSTADGVSVKRHAVTVSGESVKPEPVKPIFDEKFGLVGKVRGWLSGVNNRRRQSALSRAFSEAASRATKIGDLKKVEGETRDSLSSLLVREALGEDAGEWMPLFDPLGVEIGTLAEDGTIETLDDYKHAWREIAEGLK